MQSTQYIHVDYSYTHYADVLPLLPLPFFLLHLFPVNQPFTVNLKKKTQTCPIVLFGIGVQPPQLYRHLFFPSGRVLLHALWMKRSQILFKGVFPKSHTHYWLCVQLTLQLPTSQLQVSPDNGASNMVVCLYSSWDVSTILFDIVSKSHDKSKTRGQPLLLHATGLICSLHRRN